ncbi:MAG: pyrroline-5-carboxylate reductase [Candidatus Magasanikiibacteriota bacterium]
MKKITIIGAGTMGIIFCEALHNWDYDCIPTISSPAGDNLEKLRIKYPDAKIMNNNVEAVAEADVIILAVKPQNFSVVAGELKGKLSQDVLIISIMAGVSIEKIKEFLNVKKVVRSMPNLGSRVKKSMTVWTSSNCDEEAKDMASSLFLGIGKELYVEDENMIDKATAVSGSGPGFFFFILEKWLESVEALGFTREQAEKLVLTTLDGSLDLLKKDMKPVDLVNQVASKGGTTEAGLKVLEEADLRLIWDKVLQTAEARAKELSRG